MRQRLPQPGTNRLTTEGRAQVLGMLTEGASLRAAGRVTGVAYNTVCKLQVDIGDACAEYQDGATIRTMPATVARSRTLTLGS
jgi:hypothetical protein